MDWLLDSSKHPRTHDLSYPTDPFEFDTLAGKARQTHLKSEDWLGKVMNVLLD